MKTVNAKLMADSKQGLIKLIGNFTKDLKEKNIEIQSIGHIHRTAKGYTAIVTYELRD